MTKNNVDFTGWNFYDVHDNQGFPGCYLSPTRQDYTIEQFGKDHVVNALTWMHARFTLYARLAEASGGDLGKCELCGARLRYAGIFEGPGDTLHVVGRECAQRVMAGAEDRNEWVIASAMKDAKEINTKNGPRWKVDLLEPVGFNAVPWGDRPTYTSRWVPKKPGRNAGFGNPRVTIWAGTQLELHEKVRDFRNWCKGMNIGMATKVTKRVMGGW